MSNVMMTKEHICITDLARHMLTRDDEGEGKRKGFIFFEP